MRIAARKGGVKSERQECVYGREENISDKESRVEMGWTERERH